MNQMVSTSKQFPVGKLILLVIVLVGTAVDVTEAAAFTAFCQLVEHSATLLADKRQLCYKLDTIQSNTVYIVAYQYQITQKPGQYRRSKKDSLSPVEATRSYVCESVQITQASCSWMVAFL